tara:strand:+ start:139 stop:528 length:390 start_codon:yes stop_codon:yes gene_type:complete
MADLEVGGNYNCNIHSWGRWSGNYNIKVNELFDLLDERSNEITKYVNLTATLVKSYGDGEGWDPGKRNHNVPISVIHNITILEEGGSRYRINYSKKRSKRRSTKRKSTKRRSTKKKSKKRKYKKTRRRH